MEEIFVKLWNILKSYMKNLNMLFNNKLPTYEYTTFQIIKLLITKRNLNLIHNKNTYQHCISNFINPNITYISKSLYTRKKKNTYMTSFYIQETFYMKMENMKINNENEKYTLHFMSSYKYLHIKLYGTCNEKISK